MLEEEARIRRNTLLLNKISALSQRQVNRVIHTFNWQMSWKKLQEASTQRLPGWCVFKQTSQSAHSLSQEPDISDTKRAIPCVAGARPQEVPGVSSLEHSEPPVLSWSSV